MQQPFEPGAQQQYGDQPLHRRCRFCPWSWRSRRGLRRPLCPRCVVPLLAQLGDRGRAWPGSLSRRGRHPVVPLLVVLRAGPGVHHGVPLRVFENALAGHPLPCIEMHAPGLAHLVRTPPARLPAGRGQTGFPVQRQIVACAGVKAQCQVVGPGNTSWLNHCVSHSAPGWRAELVGPALGLFGMACHQVPVDQLAQFELGVLKEEVQGMGVLGHGGRVVVGVQRWGALMGPIVPAGLRLSLAALSTAHRVDLTNVHCWRVGAIQRQGRHRSSPRGALGPKPYDVWRIHLIVLLPRPLVVV